MRLLKLTYTVVLILCVSCILRLVGLSDILSCAEYYATVEEVYFDYYSNIEKVVVSYDVSDRHIVAEFVNTNENTVGDIVSVLSKEDSSVVYLAATNTLSKLLLVPTLIAVGCLLGIGFMIILFTCSMEDKRVQSTNYKLYKGE